MGPRIRSISSYTNYLEKDEMKQFIAGDVLPEVIVSSSYTKVWGMNYQMWQIYNSALTIANLSIIQPYDGGMNEGGGGGGGGLGGALPTDASTYDDMTTLLDILGYGTTSFSLSFDAIETMFQNPNNILKIEGIAKRLGLLGFALGISTAINNYQANGYLTDGDKINLAFTFAGLLALSPLVAPGLGLGIGIAGLFTSLYYQNPN